MKGYRGFFGAMRFAAAVLSLALVPPHQAGAVTITATDLYVVGQPPGVSAALPDQSFLYSTTSGGQVVGHGSVNAGFNFDHAVLWSPSSPNGVDLHPASGYTDSRAYATTGSQQAGYGTFTASSASHALVWSNSASNFTDLHPATGYTGSAAVGTNGTQQVGNGTITGGTIHALLWTGTPVAVDLHPATGFVNSYSLNNNSTGTRQVGYAETSAGRAHAMLWSGTAASATDLNPIPSTYFNSFALDVSGTQQVGYASVGSGTHALIWAGTAASMVDLHPASGFTSSRGIATSGTQQVGYGVPATGGHHALLWSGTAGSVVDLHTFLPAGYTGSTAYAISGDTVYGTATDGAGIHAIVWTVPEPGMIGCLGLAALMLRRRGNGRA